MIYFCPEAPPLATPGIAQAFLFDYQMPSVSSLTVEALVEPEGQRPNTRRYTLRFVQVIPGEPAWQPRTERGRRLMALRGHIVATGVALLDLDGINKEVATGRRQGA